MTEVDLRQYAPQLHPSEPLIVSLQTDTKPSVDEDGGELQVGQELIVEDTGHRYYWTGSAWALTTFGQKQDQMVELLREIRDLLKPEE